MMKLQQLDDRIVPTVVYDSPITITSGGTYTGNWESTGAATPAVTIDTDEAVTLDGCHFKGPGNLVFNDAGDGKITITNCYGYGSGTVVGHFADIDGFDRVTINNNYFENTGGIWLGDYSGNGTTDTVKILRNHVSNITGDDIQQFVQLDKVRDVPSMEIAWNEVVNEPGESLVEDVINIYESRGTSSSPMLIHDNFIKGAYPADPINDSFSGGGILVGDGDTTISATIPGYVNVYNNQVINTTNHGIAIAGGHDQSVYNNRVVSSGFLGEDFVSAQNVGIYVWDSYDNNIMHDNEGHDNVVGWVNTDQGDRNDWWVPDADSWTNNTHGFGTVTVEDEDGEYDIWSGKLYANSVHVGPPNHKGDGDGNGHINQADFLGFLAAYNITPANPIFDFDNDGDVDQDDFNAFRDIFNEDV